jgi:hypothetical protein
VEHPVVLDLRMFGVGAHLEGEEVSELTSCRFLELREHAFPGNDEPQVDVLRRTGALDPKLEDEAPLEGRGGAKDGDNPGEKAIEDEELPFTCEIRSGLHRAAETLLERLLERFG